MFRFRSWVGIMATALAFTSFGMVTSPAAAKPPVDAESLSLDKPEKDNKGLNTLVANAEVLVDEKQYDEAAALLRSALDLDPYDAPARQLMHRARAEQVEELYQRFPPYRVPVVCQGREQLQKINLSARERYVLHRIDGRRDVATLTVSTPLGELETLRALRKLHHAGLVELQ